MKEHQGKSGNEEIKKDEYCIDINDGEYTWGFQLPSNHNQMRHLRVMQQVEKTDQPVLRQINI